MHNSLELFQPVSLEIQWVGGDGKGWAAGRTSREWDKDRHFNESWEGIKNTKTCLLVEKQFESSTHLDPSLRNIAILSNMVALT